MLGVDLCGLYGQQMTDVRLVVMTALARVMKKAMPSRERKQMTTIRLAVEPTTGRAKDAMTTIRLAHEPKAQGSVTLRRGLPELPALLVSYVYLKGWPELQQQIQYRDWVLDSGAFSAHNSGVDVKLEDYIDTARKLQESDPTLSEIYALDVIGDPEASIANADEMNRQGVPAIPTFHLGSHWSYLDDIARRYDKIAIGGLAHSSHAQRMEFTGQVFARVWPKKVHGFAMAGRRMVMAYPFHSVDSTSWEIGPCKFGTYKSFRGSNLAIRGANQNLTAEVNSFLKLERLAKAKWRRELALLEAQL